MVGGGRQKIQSGAHGSTTEQEESRFVCRCFYMQRTECCDKRLFSAYQNDKKMHLNNCVFITSIIYRKKEQSTHVARCTWEKALEMDSSSVPATAKAMCVHTSMGFLILFSSHFFFFSLKLAHEIALFFRVSTTDWI